MKFIKIKNHGVKAVDNDGNETNFSEPSTLIFKVMEVPGGLDSDCITITNWEIVEDVALVAAKLQNSRDEKLFTFRGMRDGRLGLIDHATNDLSLGNRDDAAAINTCRNALFAATDPYKTSHDVASPEIDNLDLDTYEWPSI